MSDEHDAPAFTGSTTVERDGFNITSTDSEASILEVLDRENPDAGSREAADTDRSKNEAADESGGDDAVSVREVSELDGTESEPVKSDRPRDDTGKFKKLTGKARQQQIQADIDRTTYLRHEEERQLEGLRLERARLEADTERLRQPKPAAVQPNGKPSPEDIGSKYQNYEEYVEKLAEWIADTRLSAAQQQWQRQQVATNAQQQAQQAWDTHLTRIAAAKTKYPDWDVVAHKATEALAAVGLPEIPPVMMRAFLDSPRGDDILYDLGTHPEDLIRLARENVRTPVEAAPLMRQLLEARLVASSNGGPARTPISSTAKPPIQPLGSAPVVASVQPDDLDFGPEYLRLVNLESQKRGRR